MRKESLLLRLEGEKVFSPEMGKKDKEENDQSNKESDRNIYSHN